MTGGTIALVPITLLASVSAITTLLPPISATSALVTSTHVFLIVVVASIVLGLTLDLLFVVEIFTLGLNKTVRFDTGEAGEDLFGHFVALWFAWREK